MGKLYPSFIGLLILALVLLFLEIYIVVAYFQYVIFQNGFFTLIDFTIIVIIISFFTGFATLIITYFVSPRSFEDPFILLKTAILMSLLLIFGIKINEQYGYNGRLIFGCAILISLIFYSYKWYKSIFQESGIPSDEPQQSYFTPQSQGLRKTIIISDIDKMDGIEFELVLKELFQNMRYNVELTSHTNDMGADLILSKSGERISVQAKNWSANVGNSAIQEVVSSLKVYKAQRGMVITSSYFTNQAMTLADHNHVELWNRDKLIEMLTKYPVNK